MKFPPRFRTGLKNQTVPNPAQVDGAYDTYEGPYAQYVWQSPRIKKTLDAVEAILKGHGTKFSALALGYTKTYSVNPRQDAENNGCLNFCIATADGRAMLRRYDTGNATAVTYYLYAAGRATYPSAFASMSPDAREAFLNGTPHRSLKAPLRT